MDSHAVLASSAESVSSAVPAEVVSAVPVELTGLSCLLLVGCLVCEGLPGMLAVWLWW